MNIPTKEDKEKYFENLFCLYNRISDAMTTALTMMQATRTYITDNHVLGTYFTEKEKETINFIIGQINESINDTYNIIKNSGYIRQLKAICNKS